MLFGEVEDVSAELKGPNPCVSDADEEGWLLVSLPGECPLGAFTLGYGGRGSGWGAVMWCSFGSMGDACKEGQAV